MSLAKSKPTNITRKLINPLVFEARKTFFYEHANEIINSRHSHIEANFLDFFQNFGTESPVKMVKPFNEYSKLDAISKSLIKKHRPIESLYLKTKKGSGKKEEVKLKRSVKFSSHFSKRLDKIADLSRNKSKRNYIDFNGFNSQTIELETKLENLTETTRNNLQEMKNTKVTFNDNIKKAQLSKKVGKNLSKAQIIAKKLTNPFGSAGYKHCGNLKMLVVPSEIKHQMTKDRWDIKNYTFKQETMSPKYFSPTELTKIEKLSKPKKIRNVPLVEATNVTLTMMEKENLKINKALKWKQKFYRKVNKYVDPKSAIVADS